MKGDKQMALLQIRNFPDDIYGTISDIARKERRSISQQTVLLIEKGLAGGESAKERRRKVLERSWAQPVPEGLKGVDFAASIREDRDSR